MPSVGRANRVALDTNVLLSALLFSGITSRMVPLWQKNAMLPLVTGEIIMEYLRALAYPKFELTEREIRALVEEELIPFAETVPTPNHQGLPKLKDTDDLKFLACARVGKAGFLITGDQGLLALGKFQKTEILTPSRFLQQEFPD